MQLKAYTADGSLVIQSERKKITIAENTSRLDSNVSVRPSSTPGVTSRVTTISNAKKPVTTKPTLPNSPAMPPSSNQNGDNETPVTTLPSSPVNFAAAAASQVSHHVELSWSDGAGGVSTKDYVIYRNGDFLATTLDTAYTDTTTLPGYTYMYTVYARSHANSLSAQPAATSIILQEATVWGQADVAPVNEAYELGSECS